MYSKKIKIGNIMNAINSCTGMNFQKRVSDVLDVLCECNGKKYEKVEPSNGDAKNDGWIIEKNIYFAMYSPEDAKLSKNDQIVKKLDGDLDGLCNQVFNKDRWGKDISKFYLIVNTHDKELPADPDRLRENKIIEIKRKYNKEFEAEVITSSEIKKYLLNQEDEILDKISDILNIETIINDFSVADVFDFVDEYTQYLASTNIEQCDIDLLKIPTIKKIEINQLTNKKDHILKLIEASDKIDKYVSYVLAEGMDLEPYNKVKNYVIGEYKKLEKEYSGEELYERLIDILLYDNMSNSQMYILEAVIVNIFMKCDIFKKE